MEERKKFRLADVVLSVICVVFVAEAAAPVASIGNSQYFWWVFMMIAFLLPYGMISSELGTTYTGDGGLYDWINKAFPRSKWGARASWYYWINFPLWMASLAVVCPELLGVLTGLQFGWLAKLLIELAFIWIVTWIAFYPVCDSILILNISAAIKMILALTVGVLGIVYVVKNGFVNDMAFRTFLPGFDLHSLSYISVIIFNFLGFEVVCTYADNMRDPKRQIPQAVVTGGIVIALIYLFSAFGIGAAIPTHEISEDSGLIDAVSLMTGRTSGLFVGAVALLFLVTLFGNMISWSRGVNSTAAYAAKNGDMPAIFAKRWAKNDMPIGSALTSGIVASVVCILGIIIELLSPDSSLFWSFFALNLVMLLLSYASAGDRPRFRAAVSRAGRARDAARAGLCAHGAHPHLDLLHGGAAVVRYGHALVLSADHDRVDPQHRHRRNSHRGACAPASFLGGKRYGKTNHRLYAEARRLPDACGV